MNLYLVSQMLPYFFTAGHHNYARYGLYCFRCMEKLPQDVEERFTKGEHEMQHHMAVEFDQTCLLRPPS